MARLLVEHGWIVDGTLVYAIVVFGLGAIGTGHVLGVDQKLESTDIVRNDPWLRYLFG